MSKLVALMCMFGAILVVGCGPQTPLKVGFIGGLSGPNADNGKAGQDGVILAIEQFNRAGGADGRMVELISRDDAQNKEKASKSTQELVDAKVEAVIGPFTSSMATVIVPITGQAGIFQVSPTVSSIDFYGKDDNLFRINRTTRDNARDYASVMIGRGDRNFAVAYDTRNRSFTESWLNEFRTAVNTQGARLVAEVPYEAGESADFPKIVEAMLRSKPDSLFFISGALDVARLAQEARKKAPRLPIGASEWAATEQLIEFGGEVVEGLLIVQNHNSEDESLRYKEFKEAYFKRFQRNPGYSSAMAYDAATVVLNAAKQRKRGETIKQAALRSGPIQGLNQQIVFDANGDTNRKVYFTEIRGGRFVHLK
jgi:branched-chain amino acid transport system substrate-binding protein